jgi:hypothetical protein
MMPRLPDLSNGMTSSTIEFFLEYAKDLLTFVIKVEMFSKNNALKGPDWLGGE